ncbi:MAG: hypothetical protein IT452_19255 [Planctomycetia bacterium]|nr:hypothetical protein [Planctomycetia bacterium]
MRWCLAKFLELSGISLLASALYWGVGQGSMKMEMRLLALGSVVFAAGWWLEPRGAR